MGDELREPGDEIQADQEADVDEDLLSAGRFLWAALLGFIRVRISLTIFTYKHAVTWEKK